MRPSCPARRLAAQPCRDPAREGLKAPPGGGTSVREPITRERARRQGKPCGSSWPRRSPRAGRCSPRLPPRLRAARRGTTSRPTGRSSTGGARGRGGARFVYVKATESTTYRNPCFDRQYNDSRAVGLVRGAYHFALPDGSPGRAQAAHFVRNGGGWTADGWTLPSALDIEYNPYDRKRRCHGPGKAGMVGWIASFSHGTKRLTGRRPVIYTTTRRWNTCRGGSRVFAAGHIL
ncbi:GH25 family lysozyme [Streptomyces luteogriseus]|uniref:GH25 family lysozyme n=1 Tax=Streptomyces luteogriseus TaxID=68233 RepID=UPI0038131FB5